MPSAHRKQSKSAPRATPRATARREAERLLTLREYAILDTPPEAAFERIAQLAARALSVPIAMVSFVDEKRQWFKTECGLAGMKETPRDISFCQYAIRSDDVMLVPDTALDERFVNSPFVTGQPFVRFYAGAPLRASNGMNVGTLCVLDLRPRKLSATEINTLRDLAAIVVDELELRRAAGRLRREVDRRGHAEDSLSDALSSVEAQVKTRTQELSRRNEELRTEMTTRAQAEAALRESETLFRELAENVKEAFWMIDVEGKAVHYVSPAWETIWQRPVLQRGDTTAVWKASLHSDDRDRVIDEFREWSHTDFATEYRIVRPDGTVRWIHDRAFPILDPSGKVYRLAGVATDVTERKHQETLVRLRARQQQVVAELGAFALTGGEVDELLLRGCQIVQETLEIDFAGVAEHLPEQGEFIARVMVGEPVEGMIGLKIPNSAKSGSAYALLTGEPVITYDLRMETRFQVPPWAHESGTRSGAIVLIGGGGTHLPTYGTFNIFSRRLRAFPPDDVFFLQGVANVLAAAISRRRSEEALRVTKEEAELANSAKSSFLSRMSHELRTPLNAILGFSQLLQMDVQGQRQQECLRHVLTAGQQLLSMIDDVLDISRLELGSGTLALGPVAVRDAVAQGIALIKPLAAPHGISVELEESAAFDRLILVNRQRLNQILLNLFANAVKYNRPRGHVTVTCEDLPAARLRIAVRDTGVGIAPADLARLFVPFDRLGAERTSVPGTGLGLALCKNLVEAQGGQIAVESTVGEGSTFSIVLPLAAPPAALVPPPATTGPSAPHGRSAKNGRHPRGLPAVRRGPRQPARTILYIEDNLSNLCLIERLLQRHPGVKLRTATCGLDGLELARRARPDLVLLDSHLPDISGREVLTALKDVPGLSKVPVVIVSADALPASIAELRAAGARDYLTKPLDVHRLVEMLAEWA